MRKGVLLAGLLGALLWGCGGGGGSGTADGSDTGTSSYGIRISSFTVEPDTVSLGQSFTLSADYTFSSANGSVYWEVRISDQSGSQSARIASFYCGGVYGCPTSFSVTCEWYTNPYGQWLTCTDPSGNQVTVQPYAGSYTVTLEGCVWAVTSEICDSKSASVTLQ